MSALFAIHPNAVRVWRGYRDTEKMPLPDFFTKLGATFVPATVKMQVAIGLNCYLPSVPAGLPGKPDSVPDETAILFWDSQDTYTNGFKTLAVRTYTLTHNSVYRPPSGANFPTLFSGALTTEQPVFLFDKSADWMKGPVRHLLGSRKNGVTPGDFRASIAIALASVQKDAKMAGAIACASDDYLVYWELGEANAGSLNALTACLDWSKLVNCQPMAIDAGLWNEWPGMVINSGDSFNMQFQRRWEI
jgi:hypothetical protein